MCHSFRRGTMQMYQIREANSGGKSKKVVVYIIQKGLNRYIPIIYKIITQLKSSENISVKRDTSKLQNPYSQFFDLPIVITSCSNKSRSPAALLRTFVR